MPERGVVVGWQEESFAFGPIAQDHEGSVPNPPREKGECDDRPTNYGSSHVPAAGCDGACGGHRSRAHTRSRASVAGHLLSEQQLSEMLGAGQEVPLRGHLWSELLHLPRGHWRQLLHASLLT